MRATTLISFLSGAGQAMIEAWEVQEWAEREEEIRGVQEERLALLAQALQVRCGAALLVCLHNMSRVPGQKGRMACEPVSCHAVHE